MLIDGRLSEVDVFYRHVLPGVAVFPVAPSEDAVWMATQLLAQTGAQHLAIVAHGQPGIVHIGAQPLTRERLQAYQELLQEWCLEQISLYSCETAQGSLGAEFLMTLHRVSGASIAAATQKLGQVVSGGHWQLDAVLGTAKYLSPWSAELGAAYAGTLAPVTLPVTVTTPVASWQDFGVIRSGGSALSDASIPGPPGQGDAFDGALRFSLNGSPLVFPSTADLTGTTLTIQSFVASGLNVQISFYADPTLPVLRSLVSLQNPGGTAVNVDFNLQTNVGSDNSTQIIATSSGDTVFAPGDRWILTDDNPTANDPTNTHVLAGPGGLLPSAVSTTVFTSFGSEGVGATYTFSVPAGATRSLLFFNALHNTAANAQTAVTLFDSNLALLTSSLLGGFSGATLNSILNFNFGSVFAVPNAPGSGVLQTTTGSGNILLGNNSNNNIAGSDNNDTIAAFAGDDLVFGFDGNDSIDGGLGNDSLVGGNGNDTLIGGPGVDVLTGGAGADVFAFALPTHGLDTITDFVPGEDKVRVSAGGFGAGLAPGGLPGAQFTLGVAATLASHRFVYDPGTGVLSFDSDGNGPMAAIPLATLTGAPALTAADIVVS